MSRYDALSPLGLAVLDSIQPHSRHSPIALGDILRAHPAASADIPNALQALINARLISSMTHTLNGITRAVFWPTGLKHVTATGVNLMSKRPESGASTLLRAILAHGPVTGADLAMKSGIAAKNIDAILDSPNTRDVIVTRIGFCTERGRKLKHYMTRTQAEEWDAREGAAEADAPAAHVMSTPDAKQFEAEIPLNESGEDLPPPANAGLLASVSAMLMEKVDQLEEMVETLRNNITDMLNDWTDIRQQLDVSTHEEAMQAIAQMQNAFDAAVDINAGKLHTESVIHTLRNDIAAAHLIIAEVAERLGVDDYLGIPSALDELLSMEAHAPALPGQLAMVASYSLARDVAESTVSKLETVQPGRLARDVEYFDPYVNEQEAAQIVLRMVNEEDASTILLVRVLGEAMRPPAQFNRRIAPPMSVLRGMPEAA
jgi:hypothetical protein